MKDNKLKSFFLVAMMVLMGVVYPVKSQPTDSIQYYLEMAGRNNPKIKSEFLRYQSSLERIPQAGAYPDPTLDIGFFLKPMDIIDGKQVADFTLMQMFPWFGTQKAARTEAAQMAKIGRAHV